MLRTVLQSAFRGRSAWFFSALLLIMVLFLLVDNELIVTKVSRTGGIAVMTKANKTSFNVVNDTIVSGELGEHENSSGQFTISPQKMASDMSGGNVTIVVQLSGEMGNQLSKIAFGRAVQLWATDEYGINNTRLVFRAQESPKWKRAMQDTKACFPKMRSHDFRECQEEFNIMKQRQKDWLGERNASILDLIGNECKEECIVEGLSYLQTLLDSPSTQLQTNTTSMSLPFVYTATHSTKAFVTIDRYYNEIKELFAFDDEACCKLTPDPDESVFHFRNFREEMPRVWKTKGFEELSPNKTASELFGHLKQGDKVAITTRIAGPLVQEYVTSLKSLGLTVRLIEGQSPLEDFCFLLRTQKELVGMTMSTYVSWAGFLGDAKKVRLYTVDSPSRRAKFGDRTFLYYNWTNEELKSKVFFELYKSEEADSLLQETEGDSSNTTATIETVQQSHAELSTSNATATTPSNVTIVVQLSGEMGNQLSKIAFGRAVQLWAKDKYGIDNTKLILRAQEHPKWRHAMIHTKACFPHMREHDFREANTEEFNAVFAKQKEWLGEKNADLLNMKTGHCRESCIDEGLSYLQRLLHNTSYPSSNSPTNANISLPFLYANEFSNLAFVTMDRYYNEFRRLFAFDDVACCKTSPDPDESVFHLRNFRLEMPRRWDAYGFVELSPNKTAKELFGHLNPGDKVAITTRIGGPLVQEYASALEARGLTVRIVEGQSPLEDFCFLMHAQKELAGMAMSTFVTWAGYLGDPKRVRLYSVDSPSRRKRFGDDYFIHFNWTNEELKSKVVFELYKSEETDALESNAMPVTSAQNLATKNVSMNAPNGTTGETADALVQPPDDALRHTLRKLLGAVFP